jgi:hypothetical protein
MHGTFPFLGGLAGGFLFLDWLDKKKTRKDAQ